MLNRKITDLTPHFSVNTFYNTVTSNKVFHRTCYWELQSEKLDFPDLCQFTPLSQDQFSRWPVRCSPLPRTLSNTSEWHGVTASQHLTNMNHSSWLWLVNNTAAMHQPGDVNQQSVLFNLGRLNFMIRKTNFYCHLFTPKSCTLYNVCMMFLSRGHDDMHQSVFIKSSVIALP